MEHKEAITADDLEKIRRYFDDVLDVGDPVKLTQFCWFHLSIHFAWVAKKSRPPFEIQTSFSRQMLKERNTRKYIDLISRGRENTGDYFPSLHIDRGAAEVNMAREIIKPVFSRPREIRVLSQED